MAEEGTPPTTAALRAELDGLKPRALKKRAAEVSKRTDPCTLTAVRHAPMRQHRSR